MQVVSRDACKILNNQMLIFEHLVLSVLGRRSILNHFQEGFHDYLGLLHAVEGLKLLAVHQHHQSSRTHQVNHLKLDRSLFPVVAIELK